MLQISLLDKGFPTNVALEIGQIILSPNCLDGVWSCQLLDMVLLCLVGAVVVIILVPRGLGGWLPLVGVPNVKGDYRLCGEPSVQL